MEIEFEDDDLRRLASDPMFDMGFSRGIIKAFRMRVQVINAAVDERDFYALHSWRFEKLKGDLVGKYSIRLNDQWRLIVKLHKKETGKIVVIVSIVDYH